jgi:Tol biopolymer transport system component
MSLSAGTRLGPYEIVSAVGAGGMGEVYRARDTRLDRTVAIKVLREHLSSNSDFIGRFEREAKTISSLQHPNVCVLHDVGRDGDADFLVMEYLDGETLADRLARKPLSFDEALRIAVEIASALDTAHRHGVVHRDLKPGNVMLTRTATKLMDFGLAKPWAAAAAAPSFSAVATITTPVSPITVAGTVMGTLQYMSPEQLRGHEADPRSDLFAFGSILYEMLSGKRPFDGKSELSIASAIVENDPAPLSSLQPLTPPGLERVVGRCLAKDPDERWQSARDLGAELRWIAETKTATAEGNVSRKRVYQALGALFLTATALGAGFFWNRRVGPPHVIVAQIGPPENARFDFLGFAGSAGGSPALAPDGHALVFPALDETGKAMLWVRSLDSASAHPVPGTEGASDPFWSSDSRAIAFFADHRLKTIDISGGSPISLAAAPASGGGSWNRDGTILFIPATNKGVYRVASAGGTATVVVPMDSSQSELATRPRILPDGKHFVYGKQGRAGSEGIYFSSLDGKEQRAVLMGTTNASYASGYLLYLRAGTLIAQTFDASSGELKGEPHTVSERVAANDYSRLFDASQNGVLIYQTGSIVEKRLTWVDRTGRVVGTTGETGDYWDLRLAPDGLKVAVNAGIPPGSPNSEVFVDELARSVRTRLTVDPETDHGIPVWSPDGKSIVYGALAGKAHTGLYRKASNGTGGEELIVADESAVWPSSWSHDGKFILYTRGEINLASADLWIVAVTGDRKGRSFLKGAATVYGGEFSPNGRWVAYTSRESGKDEIYVVPFDARKVFSEVSEPSGGQRWQISTNGGYCARWRGDGKEIFYLSRANEMMAAQVEEKSDGIDVRATQALFRYEIQTTPFAPYDVMPDGKKFIINTPSGRSGPLTLVLNWTANLNEHRP